MTFLLERRRFLSGLFFLSLATTVVILVDLYTGTRLQEGSLLSYDPLGGARFYGVGNEYMGVLISAAICGGACGLSLWPRRVVLLGVGLYWL